MNKKDLKVTFQSTVCKTSSPLYKYWKYIINKLNLKIILSNDKKMAYCPNDIGYLVGISEFNKRYIVKKFPSVEKFIGFGNKFGKNDLVLLEANMEIERVSMPEIWDKETGYINKLRHVIFAQCWLDEPKLKQHSKMNATEIQERKSDSHADATGFIKAVNAMNHPERHPYADMACAKLNNMDLVIFGKLQEDAGSAFMEVSFADLIQRNYFNFFLCLPKHKKSVLNCLNGGESQVFFDGWYKALTDGGWKHDGWYMHEDYESRIKPKQPTKVKRWIVILANGDEIYHTKKPAVMLNSSTIREIEIEL